MIKTMKKVNNMKKIYVLISFLILSLNLSANLKKFMRENLDVMKYEKPKFIGRYNFIKFCLEQNKCDFINKKSNNYVSKETINLLTKLSVNKTYAEINNNISSAVINGKKKNFIVNALNSLQNKSLLEQRLLTKFSNKSFDYTAMLIGSNLITLVFLGYNKYLETKKIAQLKQLFLEIDYDYESDEPEIRGICPITPPSLSRNSSIEFTDEYVDKMFTKPEDFDDENCG